MKFNIDVESQLILKSMEMVPVIGPVNSLHFLKGEIKQKSVASNNSAKMFKILCSVILNLIL